MVRPKRELEHSWAVALHIAGRNSRQSQTGDNNLDHLPEHRHARRELVAAQACLN